MENTPFSLLFEILRTVGYEGDLLTERFQQMLVIIEKTALQKVSKQLDEKTLDNIDEISSTAANSTNIDEITATMDKVKEVITRNVTPDEFRRIYKEAFMSVLNDYYSSIKNSFTPDQNSVVVGYIDRIEKGL